MNQAICSQFATSLANNCKEEGIGKDDGKNKSDDHDHSGGDEESRDD